VHELIGLNAHLNFDLPSALLSVTSAAERGDDAVLAVRLADFTHIDTVMVRRIPEEYGHLRALGGPALQEVLAPTALPPELPRQQAVARGRPRIGVAQRRGAGCGARDGAGPSWRGGSPTSRCSARRRWPT
jgi:hypothetical protein